MRAFVVFTLLLAFTFSFTPLAEAAKGKKPQRGMASWYGPRHHGKRTANGEKFNMNALTAAHRTLPMNSRVRVKNLSTGKTVTVRINDRGPFSKGRIIDVSKAAAQKLGFINKGTARVEITVLPKSRKVASKK